MYYVHEKKFRIIDPTAFAWERRGGTGCPDLQQGKSTANQEAEGAIS